MSPHSSASPRVTSNVARLTEVITWRSCDSHTRQLLLELNSELLPPLLVLVPQQARIEVHCLSPESPPLNYGFRYQPPREGEARASLSLGELKELSSERVTYRLQGLSQEEQRVLWWRRALVHALGDLALSAHPSLITRRFRLVNGRGEVLGGGAQNIDEWGFSRPEGALSARLDWLTSLEEHLVPAQHSPPQGAPDNRARCQEFTKARALREALDPTLAPSLPPKECEAFWRWASRTTTVELLLSAPSGEVISSFGHLAFVTHDGAFSAPSVESPVYQFVGLIDTTGDTTGDRSWVFMKALFDELPITLNFESYLDYLKRNVDLEDREVLHYTMILSKEERTWLLAALWERLRRHHGVYSFTRHNCSSALAQLIELSLSRGEIERYKLSSQLTTSPASVISRLQRLGKLSLTSQRLSARSKQIEHITHTLQRSLQSSTAPITLPHPTASLKAQHEAWLATQAPLSALIDAWRAVEPHSEAQIRGVTSQSQHLIEQLQAYLKLYDLEPWRSRSPVRERFAPIAPHALLKMKHELFHVERDAEQVADLLSVWRRDTLTALPLSPSEELAKEQAHADQLRAEELIELVEDLLINAQAGHHKLLTHRDQLTTPTSPLISSPLPLKHLPGQLSPRWGGDQSYELSLLSQGSELISGLSVSLYDERLGRARHALFAGTRTLTIAHISLSGTSAAQALSLTPLTFEGSPRSTWSLLTAFSLSAHLGHQLPRGGAQLEGYLGVGSALLLWAERRGQLTYHLFGSGGAHLRAPLRRGLLGRVRLLTPLWGPLTFQATLTHSLAGHDDLCLSALQPSRCVFEPSDHLTTGPLISSSNTLKRLSQRNVKITLTTPLLTQAQHTLWLSLEALPFSPKHVMSMSLSFY